jgi:2-polyprenyl-3-methyl-5-hydroxy-6-metoxy-1,4-benzoquinol methylase
MIPCDICGDANPKQILEAPLLDGPLVQCPSCGLKYVGKRMSQLAFGSDEAAAVVQRVHAANAGLRNLPLEEEERLAALNARQRLNLVRKFRPSGKLLEVGCGRGDFLKLARDYYTAFGVEPNPELAALANEYAPVHTGTLESEPGRHYDLAVSFHVIEHVDSPRSFLAEMSRRLRPDGIVALETPNIDSLPFRLMKRRWRQFIPEHYFFFDEKTITKLLEAEHFRVLEIRAVGKFASTGLILNRLSRYFSPFRYAEKLSRLMRLSSLSFQMDPMDIMFVVAIKQEPPPEPAQEDAAAKP